MSYGPHATVRIGCPWCHGPPEVRDGREGLLCPHCAAWMREAIGEPYYRNPDAPRLHGRWRAMLARHERRLRECV